MSDAAAAPAETQASGRPVKPDEAAFQQALEKAEKEHKDVMARFNAVKAKIEIAQPKKDGAPSPVQKRRQELIAQLNEIRTKQAGSKSSRTSKLDQIKRLDEQLRSRIAEQKAARGKVPFKSVEDLDNQIKRLEDQVNGGMMKLVDEKKALAEITNLKKVRKNFSAFDVQEKQISDLRTQIKQIKESMEDPEAKALSDKYNTIQAELDTIKAEQDGVYKNLSSLRDERSKLHSEQRDKFEAIRKIKDDYYGAKKAFAAYEREARAKANERRQAERERHERERKKERAQQMLAEASDPAYLDEIRRARNLLHSLDPSFAPAPAAAAAASTNGSLLVAKDIRKVDDSGLKGTRLLRKEDRGEDYFLGSSGKKSGGGKKGKKEPTAKGFSVSPAVIEDCASMGLNPPTSAADVPGVIEKVKAKLDTWVADQDAQTKRNIEKAKKEIEKLEKEEEGGDKKADDDKVAEVTADLKEASVEDKQEKADEKIEA